MKKGFLIILLLISSTAFAGIDVVYNELDFELNNDGVNYCMLPGSNYIEGEDTVTLKFEIVFTGSSHENGTLASITANIEYDDDNWEFLGAEKTGWSGAMTPSEGDGIITLIFDGQTMAPPETLTGMAKLHFRSLCQAVSANTTVIFDNTSTNQAVVTYNGGATSETFIADLDAGGYIRVLNNLQTWYLIDCYNDAVSPMGDTASVNIIFAQPHAFYLHTVDMQISFSTDSLEFVDFTFNPTFFDAGHNSSYSCNSGVLTLNMQDASDGIINPPAVDPYSETMGTARFIVKGVHGLPGNSVPLTMVSCAQTAYTDWGGGYEACAAYNNSLGLYAYHGDIDVPTYSTAIDITPAENAYDEYYRKGDGVFDMVVSMQNNYPAGQNVYGGDGAINTLFDIPSFVGLNSLKETPYLDFNAQTYINGIRVCYNSQQYNGSYTPNFHYSTNDFSVLDTITFSLTDAQYTPDWDDNTFDVSWRETGNSWYTKVVDITGYDTTFFNEMTLTADEKPVHVGLFESFFCYDGDVTVSQPIYLKSTFDVGEFTVDVACDANAIINSVTCYNGTSTSSVSTREKTIYYDGAGKFCDATGDGDSVHIATVNYRVQCSAAKASGDGGGGGETWYYVTSGISFNDEEMNEYGGDEMFVDLQPSNIRGKCGIIIRDPIDKLSDNGMPEHFALHPNRPNPFNPTTIIGYDLPQAAHVTIDIINISGQRVAKIVDDYIEAGRHEVMWDGRSDGGIKMASGVYFYTIRAGEFRDTKKMVLMK